MEELGILVPPSGASDCFRGLMTFITGGIVFCTISRFSHHNETIWIVGCAGYAAKTPTVDYMLIMRPQCRCGLAAGADPTNPRQAARTGGSSIQERNSLIRILPHLHRSIRRDYTLLKTRLVNKYCTELAATRSRRRATGAGGTPGVRSPNFPSNLI